MISKPVPVGTLQKHPLTVQIYSDKPNDDLLESMRDTVQQVPIIVAADGKTIVDGASRWQCAKILKWKEVRIVVRPDLVHDLDIRVALIHANTHREKTVEQKGREYKELKRIEELRAAKTQAKTSSRTDPVQAEPPKGGRPSTAAAAKVGLGRDSAIKASKVIDEIDIAEEAGDTERAEDLRETLNTNVTKAHAKATSKKDKPEPTDEEYAADRLNALANTLSKMAGTLAELRELLGGRVPADKWIEELDEVHIGMKRCQKQLLK